ncbi:MAG: hypothetical protein MI757_05445, partial [Pirellulales bacterium]|nr:hypothetical protein [Pirellulales bacterium]
ARMAMPGESVEVPAGATVTAKLRMTVPPTDWRGQPNRIDEVELIAVGADRAISLAKAAPAESGPAMTHTFAMPEQGIVLRARGRRVVADGPDLMFYTNPIRMVASKPE